MLYVASVLRIIKLITIFSDDAVINLEHTLSGAALSLRARRRTVKGIQALLCEMT